MSIEAITDTIHEYMYEKLHKSPETEEEKENSTRRQKKVNQK